ncbi:unnamed protein product [Pylaiella littoralis]
MLCNEQWGSEALERTRAGLPRYGKGTQIARKTFVRGCITLEDRRLHIRDGLNPLPVCLNFFRALHGVSYNLLSSAGSLGSVSMKRRDPVNSTAQLIVVWLEELASHWELQPDRYEIHMSFPDHKMVYLLFCASASVESFHRVASAYAYFTRVWKRDCAHIKLKKTMRFTKRDVCTLAVEALDVERRRGGFGWLSEDMQKIKRHLLDHHEDVKRSRKAYMAAKEQAKTNPDSILVMAVDGADQQLFALPYFRQLTKDTARGWKMRTKLIGALVTGEMMMFFTLASNWETGANLTIQVVHSTLVQLIKSLGEGKALPRRLWLQMDNCSRENKNRIFLAYLHMLVQFGVFDVIEVHFGLKGHTHDEIDQVFSRVGTGLKKRNVATQTILGEGVLRSYRVGAPNFFVGIEHLKNLANIRDLLDGCMYPIPLVTRPQAFKVSKDPTDGNVKMQARRVQQRLLNDHEDLPGLS